MSKKDNIETLLKYNYIDHSKEQMVIAVFILTEGKI